MAYTAQTPLRPSTAGTTAALTAPPGVGTGNGDAVPPGAWLLINNGSASPITITLNIGRTYQGYTITAPTVSIPATTQMAIGPLPADPFEQLAGTNQGYCLVDYSSITTVTRAIFSTS